MNSSRLNEEEVLLAFAVEPRHDNETLTRYLKNYPEYSTALVNLSTELMIEDCREVNEDFSSSSAVSKAWQRFNEAVAIDNCKRPITNPFAGLNSEHLKAVAEKIGINKLLLVRLRDRGIDIATIPNRFVEKAAIALGVTADALRFYLIGPPCIVSDLSFRSDVKPIVTAQISFTQAIESSQLTAQQQTEMKALLED